MKPLASEWGKLDWNNKYEEEFEEPDEKICNIGKKKIVGSEMQETIEEKKQKQEKRSEKRQGKEIVEEKSQNNFINRNWPQMWEDEKRTILGHTI